MNETIKPMKMTDIAVTEAPNYLVDNDWALEQKMDGARALVSWNPINGFEWQASGGGPLKFAAAVQHFEAIEAELLTMFEAAQVISAVVDGEIIVEDGTYHAFDLPYVHYAHQDFPFITPPMKYVHRRNQLSHIVDTVPGERVVTVYSARTPAEKVLLWEKINSEGVEGGMVKDLYAPYESGVRSKRQLKLKLVKTADVIVLSAERKFDHKGMVTHGSADIGVAIDPVEDPAPYRSPVTGKRINEETRARMMVGTKSMQARALAHEYAPRDVLPVGAASLIGKDLTIEPGDVVEVNYLYWTGDALVQPRIVRKRLPEEKVAEQCTLDQLPVYSRVAVGR